MEKGQLENTGAGVACNKLDLTEISCVLCWLYRGQMQLYFCLHVSKMLSKLLKMPLDPENTCVYQAILRCTER